MCLSSLGEVSAKNLSKFKKNLSNFIYFLLCVPFFTSLSLSLSLSLFLFATYFVRVFSLMKRARQRLKHALRPDLVELVAKGVDDYPPLKLVGGGQASILWRPGIEEEDDSNKFLEVA